MITRIYIRKWRCIVKIKTYKFKTFYNYHYLVTEISVATDEIGHTDLCRYTHAIPHPPTVISSAPQTRERRSSRPRSSFRGFDPSRPHETVVQAFLLGGPTSLLPFEYSPIQCSSFSVHVFQSSSRSTSSMRTSPNPE